MAEKNLPKINQIDRPFWQGAAEGKFLLQHCRACGKLQFFPRVVCTGCFGAALDWVEARGEGEIHSYSWVFVPRNPAFKEEVPICYANVVLDEGVILESRIVGKRVAEIKLGDRVRVAFQETSDPEIKLPVFELTDRP